jgi:hypothetical protein
LQEKPQEVPLHVPVALAGGGEQGEHEVPHDAVEALLWHVPPQVCMPAGQAHALLWHVIPPAHAFPQAPQLLASLVKSAHPPAQAV